MCMHVFCVCVCVWGGDYQAVTLLHETVRVGVQPGGSGGCRPPHGRRRGCRLPGPEPGLSMKLVSLTLMMLLWQ